MRSLLSERDLRIILILEILLSSEWVSLTTLTNYLECSEKTIRNDLGLITTEFEEIVIESSPQLGYHLTHHNSFPIENTIDQIINSTLIFQLLRMLLENSNLKLTELETLLFVSANSIRNVVKEFNKKLENDNVSIQSRPFRIEGDEVKITSLFFIRLKQSYFSRGMLEDEIFNFIEELIPQLFADNPSLKALFVHDIYSLNILLYIRIFREINNHTFHFTTEQPYIDYHLTEDSAVLKGFNKLFHTPLTNDLLNNIINFVLDQHTASDYLQLVFLFKNSDECHEIENNLQPMIQSIANNLVLDLTNEADFHSIIQSNYQSTIDFPFDYRTHKTLLKILTYEHRKVLTQTQEYKYQTFYNNKLLIQLAYHLQVAWPKLVSRVKQLNKKMIVSVLLVTDSDTKMLYKSYLNYNFSHKIDFKFIETYPSKPSHDLLITNNFDYPVTETAVLNVAGLPNENLYNNILRIYRFYQQQNYDQYYTNNPNLLTES